MPGVFAEDGVDVGDPVQQVAAGLSAGVVYKSEAAPGLAHGEHLFPELSALHGTEQGRPGMLVASQRDDLQGTVGPGEVDCGDTEAERLHHRLGQQVEHRKQFMGDPRCAGRR